MMPIGPMALSNVLPHTHLLFHRASLPKAKSESWLSAPSDNHRKPLCACREHPFVNSCLHHRSVVRTGLCLSASNTICFRKILREDRIEQNDTNPISVLTNWENWLEFQWLECALIQQKFTLSLTCSGFEWPSLTWVFPLSCCRLLMRNKTRRPSWR